MANMAKRYTFTDTGCSIFGSYETFNKVLYGGHPNAVGCRLWGDALYEFVSENIDVFGK